MKIYHKLNEWTPAYTKIEFNLLCWRTLAWSRLPTTWAKLNGSDAAGRRAPDNRKWARALAPAAGARAWQARDNQAVRRVGEFPLCSRLVPNL